MKQVVSIVTTSLLLTLGEPCGWQLGYTRRLAGARGTRGTKPTRAPAGGAAGDPPLGPPHAPFVPPVSLLLAERPDPTDHALVMVTLALERTGWTAPP